MALQKYTKRILVGILMLLELWAFPVSNPAISIAETMVSRSEPASSMHGTLIGNFITANSIVIGSDSIVSDDNGVFLQETDKTCQPSPRSIATIQGEYGMPVISGKSSAFLYHAFRVACSELLNRKTPQSLDKQADILIEALQSELKKNLDDIPIAKLERIAKNANHINYVSVSGYSSDVPRVYLRELKVVRNSGKWQTATNHVPNLSPEPCGARFHGEAKVVNLLMQGFAPNVLSQTEFLRDEVVAGRVANQSQSCVSFTEKHAWDLFQTAVRLTNNHGPKVIVKKGRVGGTLRCWSITKVAGAIPC
jgi:hypothetical protein